MRGLGLILLALAGAGSARGAVQAPPESGEHDAVWQLALRVAATPRPGEVVVDRGARDGLAVGDTVTFHPRDGGEHIGQVREVLSDRATVALAPGAPALPLGTRGSARVLRAARTPTAPSAPAPADAQTAADAAGLAPDPSTEGRAERPAATDAWTSDQPLLAGTPALRPAERPRALTGRFWTSFDAIEGLETARRDTFLRVGTDLALENPFGSGGVLVFDGEVTHRTRSFAPEMNASDEDAALLRIDRLYYEVGGTRFEPERWTFGRFVSRDLPELGVQDGVEWSRRSAGGHEFGGAVAALPELDPRLDGTSDLGLTAWYRWAPAANAEQMLTAAFHKSFHDGRSDRDLFVLKAQHLPRDGWTAVGSAWVDLHTGDDVDEGLRLTEAHLAAGRSFSGLHDVRVVYTHREFPELLRGDRPRVGVEALADGALDRLGVAGSMALPGRRRVTGRAGAWADEDDSGGDFELGYDTRAPLLPDARLELGLFVAQGETSALRGARASLAQVLGAVDWRLTYEVQEDRFDGFEALNDDALQHRVRASGNWFGATGWLLEVYAELQLQDIDDAVLVGFHFGRSF